MKKGISFLMVICVLALWSCKKELPRDNPNDLHNPNGYKTGLAFSRAVITDDTDIEYPGSHNGQINLNERIQFKVYLKNTGQKTLQNVTGHIDNPSNTYIEDFGTNGGNYSSVQVSFGNITPGAEAASNETMKFDVTGPGANIGDNITFTLNYKDDNGDSGSSTFGFTIEAFKPMYNFKQLQPQLLSTDQYDGAIRPGANIEIGLEIENTGSVASPYMFSSSFNSGTGNVYLIQPDFMEIGYINAKAISTQIGTNMTISRNAAPNTTEIINYNLVDGLGNTWPESFSIAIVQ